MLRACILDHKGSWEEHLPLVEFTYNNSYQASIQMAPYEALYERSCRSPLCWTEVGESSITSPDIIRNTSEKVSLIRQRLLTALSRQKSYADVRRRPLEFEVGDHVFLKVMPKRGVVRFDKRGKLSLRFIGLFEILERVGTVAYRLALPPSMSGVHKVFHVSMLRKYTPDPAHVVDWRHIEVETNGTFEEGPVCIVDSRDQVLRCKTVRLVRVLWRHYRVEESTWEREDTMRATYPFLFRDEGTWFEVDTNGTFEEGPVCVVDSRDQVLRRKTVRLVRVLWRHYGVEESTWKSEDTMRATYPFLFRDEGTWFSRLRFK